MTYPVVVYGVPYTPPAPPVKPFRAGQNRWFGWDGSVWDLADHAGGVIFADGGATGFHFPPFERQTTVSPAMSGTRWRGVRTAERPVDWNLLIWSDNSSEEWRARDAGFMKTLRPDKTGTWEHTTPEGKRRFLTLRYTESEMTSLERRDPHELGWSLYQVQMVAEDPYWHGESIVRSWTPPSGTDGEDFFNEGEAPPFIITAASNITDAKLPNPGDVEAWPIWTFIGPLQNISVGFNGGEVALPNVAGGQTMVVNTDPRVATATRNGADVMGLVDTWDPRPIPAGGQAVMDVDVEGTGIVRASLEPRYYRAW